MKKQEKLAFIEEVNDRFINARNHGRGGSNWWNPTQNIIAYNVKMYAAGVSTEDIRAKLSDKQNEYYCADEFFNNVYWQYLNDVASMHIEDIKEQHSLVIGCCMAGRSGGWLEVEYQNNIDFYDDDYKNQYKIALELGKQENSVSEYIKRAKSSHEKYLSSTEYITDIIENNLMSDDDIADIYRSKINSIIDKLK